MFPQWWERGTDFKREIKGVRGGCKGKGIKRMQLFYDENLFMRNWWKKKMTVHFAVEWNEP